MTDKTCFVPTLNGVTTLEKAFIREFEFVSSISGQLPLGYFTYYDQDGTFLSKFENLAVGTPITFKTVTDSENEDLKKFKFKDYVILGVNSLNGTGSAGQFDKIKGNIQVWFGHKWYLYKDTKNHAYAPMKNSKLVEKILKDDTRGFSFKINKIIESDDEGNVSRYKTCETDIDFLNNKVIPYCSHKKLPMYLFCNISNEFTFSSFLKMYEQKPKVLYMPAVVTEDDNADKVKAEQEKNSLKCSDEDSFIFASIDLATKQFVDKSKIRLFLESNGDGLFISGAKTPGNTVGKNTGSKFFNLLPLNQHFAMTSTGSSTFTVRNRSMQDAMSFAYSQTKELDSCFKLTISGYFNAKQYNVGETVNIYFNLGNWLNGKWLIESFMIATSEGDSRKDNLLQSLVLIRPAFVGDTNTSTIDKKTSTFMYSVK
ncbi:MAG: hypothetical protein HUJ68_07400 [Clostridia bacterium]|nr:hypothetical protein [Clostridia bacterium]